MRLVLPARSTIDMPIVVRRLLELGRRRKIPLYVCFIDLHKAYGSVDRELLWEVLIRSGVDAYAFRQCPGRDAGSRAYG